MRNKWGSRKFWMALLMCVLLVWCAMEAEETMRLALLALAVMVACVWMICESRIDRAAAPLKIEQDADPENKHPPDPA